VRHDRDTVASRITSAKAAFGIAAFAGVLLVSAVPAQTQSPRQPTGYDKRWHISQYWTGEYPSGFGVISPKVVVAGRSKLDKNAPRNVKCELPYLAVIHPWNDVRRKKSKIEFWSATKIVPLIAKQRFVFSPTLETKIAIKKGDVIEYVRNSGEGFFKVRISGRIYDAGQNLFEHTEDVAPEQFDVEEWIALNCVEGRRAYVLYPQDLADPEHPEKFQPGLIDHGRSATEPFGKRQDFTEDEARAERAREQLP
jgi:hypothetical protein